MKRRTIILIHFLFWFYIINQAVFPLYVGSLEEINMQESQYFREVLISLLMNLISFYSIYFAFPRISAIRSRLLMVSVSLLIIFLISGIRLGLSWWLWRILMPDPGKPLELQWIWAWNELRLVIITGIYAVLIRFMIRAFEAQKLRNELTNQRQAGELALIKAQVNPHFLFNTLNNIYSLVLKKSDEAPEAVMKFSSIMRYVLSEANNETVQLDREIEYLRSYIELQKFRFSKPGYVVINVSGNTGKTRIAPMLLIPFVENAFKHGSKKQQPGIIVDLAADDGKIHFRVVNYIKENQQPPKNNSFVSGLSNIRRRLELSYPGKHELQVKQENGQHIVNLLIRL